MRYIIILLLLILLAGCGRPPGPIFVGLPPDDYDPPADFWAPGGHGLDHNEGNGGSG